MQTLKIKWSVFIFWRQTRNHTCIWHTSKNWYHVKPNAKIFLGALLMSGRPLWLVSWSLFRCGQDGWNTWRQNARRYSLTGTHLQHTCSTRVQRKWRPHIKPPLTQFPLPIKWSLVISLYTTRSAWCKLFYRTLHRHRRWWNVFLLAGQSAPLWDELVSSTSTHSAACCQM